MGIQVGRLVAAVQHPPNHKHREGDGDQFPDVGRHGVAPGQYLPALQPADAALTNSPHSIAAIFTANGPTKTMAAPTSNAVVNFSQ